MGPGTWWRYAAGRLAVAVPTLLVLCTLAFLLVRLAPGGPFDAEQSLVETRRNQLDNLVTLYVALGGGLIE